MTSRDNQRGQATTDYMALLGLLAVLLVVAAGIASGAAPGIVNAVRGQMASALCIVTGGTCPVEPPRPCAVAIKRESRRYGVMLGVVKLDKDRLLMREQLSDHTIRLTLLRRFGAGFDIGVGARVQIDEALESTSAGGFRREARFGAQGVLGLGSVYYAHSPREADRISKALKDGDEPAAPVRETLIDGGLRGSASLKAGLPSSGLGLDWTSMRTLGLRRNLQTGESTIAFTMGDGGSAFAASIAGGPTASLEGMTTFALKLDRRNRPIELSLLAIGTVRAGGKLSKVLATPLALSGYEAPANQGGRRWEFGARLNLTDPQVGAAWRRFRDDPTSLVAIRELAQTLRDRAQLDVRTYRARTSSNGTSISLALGIKLGAEADSVIDRFNLLAASSRPPGGLWERRFDCV